MTDSEAGVPYEQGHSLIPAGNETIASSSLDDLLSEAFPTEFDFNFDFLPLNENL